MLLSNIVLYDMIKGMKTVSGEATLSKWFCLLSEKGPILKGKNLLPVRSKFFPFRVDPVGADSFL